MITCRLNRFKIFYCSCLLLSLLFTSARTAAQEKIPVEVKDSLGMLREKGFSVQGQRNGMWTFYDSKGQISKKVKYRRDVAVWTFIYENGAITESINRKGKVKKRTCNCPN